MSIRVFSVPQGTMPARTTARTPKPSAPRGRGGVPPKLAEGSMARALEIARTWGERSRPRRCD